MHPAPVRYIVREERAGDAAAIAEVHRLAFHGGADEVAVVGRLRDAGLIVASLVTEQEGRITGHILFSRLCIEAASGPLDAVALAPMAVHPGDQMKGIGSSLVRRGLALCRDRGERIVIVVGHPSYYPKFGFSAELARSLKAPFSGEIFMACELVPGALSGVSGRVVYPPAFDGML